MEKLIELRQKTPGVVVLTLNRPQRRNALTIALMEQLCGQLGQLETSKACRAVVLRGAGPAFCAGLDLVEARDQEVAEESARWVARTFQTIANSTLVTVAAAHGAAMAGGAGLMAACDFAVAASDLKIGFPEVRRGLVPSLVSTVLRDRLSLSMLRELFLLGEPIDGRRAQAIGLVNRVVGPADVESEALELAEQVCRGGPVAIRQTKQLLADIRSLSHDDHLKRALASHYAARSSAEAQEGLAAFLEKRDPRWNV